METVDRRSFKQKVKDGCTKVKEDWRAFTTWAKENPNDAAKLIGSVITGTALAVNTCAKLYQAHEKQEQRRTVYCNDVQSYVKLKHELNYDEARELRDRMNCGETKFEALDSMDLLKR